MTAFIILSGLGALAAVAIAGTLMSIVHDGYRRTPQRRLLREYERDEHYRA